MVIDIHEFPDPKADTTPDSDDQGGQDPPAPPQPPREPEIEWGLEAAAPPDDDRLLIEKPAVPDVAWEDEEE